MKIAYLGPTGIFGGVRVLVEHLNRLSDRGHECTLISTTGAPMNWLPCRFEQIGPDDLRHILTVSESGSGMTPNRTFDVIVGTALSTWATAAKWVEDSFAGRAFGLLQMADYLFFPKGSPDYQATLAAFTAPVEVLAISEWLSQLAEAAGHVTHRIRNGIDTNLFHYESFPDVPAFDGITVVTEGYSHNPAKDTDEYFKRAVRHLRWDEGRAIRAIGFSQYQQSFEFDAFWQQPAQDIIRRIYSSGDIFLKASRYEGRPGPDLEAMACGAVICRAIGTGDDDLIDGENCLKVPYGDYDGFVANFRRLMDDADLRARLKANALEYVKMKCDWAGAIDLVEQALTGNVTVPDLTKHHAYALADYNAMQAQIVGWETPQAMWLGETLADLLHPESVIDVGCGPGTYLVPFKPDARVLGVDGAPEAGQALESDEFVRADLREDWSPDGVGPFDLSLCIETAEHLPPDRADYLIDLLTGCADVCFFSAAHPGQGGTLHLNEQPREYWLEKFRARGFDLHPKHEWLAQQIAASPECRRVQWLVSNGMLLGKMNGHA